MQTRPSPRDHAVPGDGVRLHVRDWGGGPGPGGRPAPAVVLLHGLASNARIWDGVAPALVEAGLRVVALDQRGHGESEQPGDGYDFAGVCRDLAAAVAALGFTRPLLVGHSWGANVSLQYAADRDQVAGLALVDGGFIEVSAWPGMTRQRARERLAPPRFAVPVREWLDRASGWLPPTVDSRDGWVRDFLRAGVEVDTAGVARARFRFANHLQVIEALYDQHPSALYARVACPALLCVALEDNEFDLIKRNAVALAAERLPHVRTIWFEETMHDIPLQHPAALAAELVRFAEAVRAGG